jgi:DNA-binding NarL/FixJ family response regulator
VKKEARLCGDLHMPRDLAATTATVSELGPLTCIVVEDNGFMRQSICTVLSREGFAVPVPFPSAATAAQWFKPGLVEVGIFDLDLGAGPTGADLATKLRRLQPDLGVVLLTVTADPRLLGVQAADLPLGTRYVLKDRLTDGTELRDAVLSAAAQPAGETGSDSPFAVPRVELGDGQVEVLRLIAEGLSNAEIARRRHTTVQAVERAVTRLNRQLGISADHTTSARVRLAAYYWTMRGGGSR